MRISYRFSINIIIAFLLLPAYSYSQVVEFETQLLPGNPISETVNLYEISSYPQNWTITKDWDGNLLVGTLGNTMVFDGARWRSHSVPGNTTRALVPAYDGKIFVGGTNEFGYFERENSSLTDEMKYVSLRDLVPDRFDNIDRVQRVIVTPDSSVIFNATFNTFKYNNGELSSFNDGVWVFRVFYVNGNIMTNDSLGISLYDSNTLDLIPGADEFEYIGIYCIEPIGQDQFLFTVGSRGLFKYDGLLFTEIESDASEFFKQHSVTACASLPDGSYLIGTQSAGALRINSSGDILGWYNESTGLPENRVYSIHAEFDGTVWLSHFNHITKMDLGLPLRVISESSGYNSVPFSMHLWGDEIYVGTRLGLFKSNSDLNFNFDFEQVVSSSSIIKFVEFRDDLLFYTKRNIYSVKSPQEALYRSLFSFDTIEASYVNQNLLITASNDGLYLIILDENGQLESASQVSSINLDGAQIVQNESGDVWIGSSSGNLVKLLYSDIEQFLESGNAEPFLYEMPEGWRGDGSRRIAVLKVDDDILLGTPRGLYSIDLESDTVVEDNRFGEWSRRNDRGGVNPILRLESDSEGNVWMRGSRNYQYVERREDGSYVVHSDILKRIDDDVSNQIVPLGEGKAWFLGSKGLIYYDHNLVTERSIRPPIIRRVTANSDSIVYRGYSREKSATSLLTLDYNNNDLRVEFALPDFSSFNGTEYQVMLKGFDDDWTIWSEEAQKDYTQVREGSYSFMVRARDVTGVVTEASIMPIRILPPWYRTLWAYGLYLAFISMLLYTIHKYRINKILAIQKVRNRIANDLHDEVSATLSSITFFTEAIQKNKENDKSAKYLSLISESAGDAKEKMSDIIWSIDPEHDSWDTLISKCKRFASDLFETKEIKYSLKFPDQISGKINIENRQNIWLMFKEIITNTVRHSGATQAEVDVSFKNGKMRIKVTDNGSGFDVGSVKTGNGVKNIRTRAEELKGKASVKSEPDKGTEWIIDIPL